MALTDENNMVMPVSPMYGYGNGSNGMFGGDWAWIILLLLLGWGNNGLGGYGGGNQAATLYPWMNQADITSQGFQNQQLSNQLTSINQGVQGLSNQLCNGFNGVVQATQQGFSAAEANANTRQIANMQQDFASQTAMMNGFNNLSQNFSNCCCENRLGLANLAATVASENCADREALNYATRDILNNQTQSVQRILDQMCQDKIDAKNEKIAELQNQLTLANLAASQNAQTAQILADNQNQTQALEQYLNPAPIPAYVVQNPNCCQQTCGCGCGM